ncbi:MAG: hypothetical protein AAGA50_27370, partial [Pseudomonadota bacterium]
LSIYSAGKICSKVALGACRLKPQNRQNVILGNASYPPEAGLADWKQLTFLFKHCMKRDLFCLAQPN